MLFITLILQLIATAQVFLEPFLFTGGGPANATMTVLLLISATRSRTAWAATTGWRRR